jgi:hypothetical protein
MAKKTTPNDATVQTLTVEVKTVLIGNRQMTWNFYRQVPWAEVVASDGTLRGNVWGQLRACHQEKHCADHKHLHLLWELAGELRRGTVYAEPGTHGPIRDRGATLCKSRSLVRELALAVDALYVLDKPTDVHYTKSPRQTLTTPRGSRELKWYSCLPEGVERQLSYFFDYPEGRRKCLQQSLTDRWPEFFRPFGDSLFLAQQAFCVARQHCKDEESLLKASEDAWDALYSQLASIPQIYIREFLARKSQLGGEHGFKPLWLPDCLFGFQRYLDEWAIRRGRAADLRRLRAGEDAHVPRLGGERRPAHQPPRPRGDDAGRLRAGVRRPTSSASRRCGARTASSRPGARVVVTNYERLHHFDPADFAGVVANESSILKNFKGKTKADRHRVPAHLPYRLLCTATAAPNDYVELGTSSEALGELGYQDMLTMFFVKHLAARGTVGWGREQYRMKGHAEKEFWRWVCELGPRLPQALRPGASTTPASSCPPLVREHVVKSRTRPPGRLFDVPAVTMDEQREELRRTLTERCEKAAELLTHDRPALAWCYLNDEGRLLARLIPGAVEGQRGRHDDEKEEKPRGVRRRPDPRPREQAEGGRVRAQLAALRPHDVFPLALLGAVAPGRPPVLALRPDFPRDGGRGDHGGDGGVLDNLRNKEEKVQTGCSTAGRSH